MAKTPTPIIEKLTPTLREQWDDYFKNSFNGDDPHYYNGLIAEIEAQLPFENEEQHKKWLELGSAWRGEPEWPQMTNDLVDKVMADDIRDFIDSELKGNHNAYDYANVRDRASRKFRLDKTKIDDYYKRNGKEVPKKENPFIKAFIKE